MGHGRPRRIHRECGLYGDDESDELKSGRDTAGGIDVPPAGGKRRRWAEARSDTAYGLQP
jgi:hypothetical protein